MIDEEKRIEMPHFNNGLFFVKSDVTSILRKNHNFARLLEYGNSGALDETNLINSSILKKLFTQGTPDTRVFLTGFDVNAIKETRSEVHIHYPRISMKKSQSGLSILPILAIDSIVHNSQLVLSGTNGLRHEHLFQLIHDDIVGQPIGAIGYIELIEAWEDILPGNTHVIYSARYGIGGIKRDK